MRTLRTLPFPSAFSVILLLPVLLHGIPATAQQGSLDTTFDGDGKLVEPIDWGGDLSDLPGDVAIQFDGKIVVAGTASITSTDSDFVVIRMLVDGTPDYGFGSYGKKQIYFDLGGNLYDHAEAVAIQGDGKIVVAGRADGPGINDPFAGPDNVDFAIARLDATGQLDSTFGGDGRVSYAFDQGGNGLDTLSGLLIQSDGKIVATGTVQTGTSNYDFAALRLNADGSLDTSFGIGGWKVVPFDLGSGGYDECNASALQNDDKIVLAGSVKIGNGTDRDFGIVRLRADGSLDPTFDGDGKKTVYFDLVTGGADAALSVAVDMTGKILLAGLANVSIEGSQGVVARLTPLGAHDTSFDLDGKVVVAGSQVLDVEPAAQGKIVIAGRVFPIFSLNADFIVERLLADGSPDSTFGNQGTSLIAFDLGPNEADVLSAMAVQLDGGIVVTGWIERNSSGDYDFGLARLVGEPFFSFP